MKRNKSDVNYFA